MTDTITSPPQSEGEALGIERELTLDIQLDWLKGEMLYSADKTDGYEVKLARLVKPQGQAGTVSAFMESYFSRFELLTEQALELQAQGETGVAAIAASKGLGQFMKMTAGLADKVAMSYWLETGINDRKMLVETTLERLRVESRMPRSRPQPSIEELLRVGFKTTPAHRAITAGHDAILNSAGDYAGLRRAFIEGTVLSIDFWRELHNLLQAEGINVTIPAPGEVNSGGGLEPWFNVPAFTEVNH